MANRFLEVSNKFRLSRVKVLGHMQYLCSFVSFILYINIIGSLNTSQNIILILREYLKVTDFLSSETAFCHSVVLPYLPSDLKLRTKFLRGSYHKN